MAKKNSTKTATKEALQSSEPKIQAFKGWTGINISEIAPGIDAFGSYNGHTNIAGNSDNQYLETDIQSTTLMLQNNAVTTLNKNIETRRDGVLICKSESFGEPTGEAFVTDDYLFFIVEDNDRHHLCRKKLHGTGISVKKVFSWPSTISVKKIGRFQDNFIAAAYSSTTKRGLIYFTSISDAETSSTVSLNTPSKLPDLSLGNYHIDILSSNNKHKSGTELTLSSSYSSSTYIRYSFFISYTNSVGTTTTSTAYTVYTDAAPEEMNSKKYIPIRVKVPDSINVDANGITGASGADLWYTTEEYVEKAFLGHVDFQKYTADEASAFNSENSGANVEEGDIKREYYFDWLGAMQDTSSWADNSSYEPTENTTQGVDAEYFSGIDGRLYFWGGANKSRLYIGGNPGHSLSVARGYGGAYVDIDPGSGSEIMNCLRFKTTGGSNIVTVLCNSKNSTMTKRYNIIETKISLTNEVSSKSYYAEEVQNVIGCISKQGSGAFADGLYSLGRYGLYVTTSMMEYNTQLRSNLVSDPIKPLFTDIDGYKLESAKLFHLNDIIYMSFAYSDDVNEDSLDSVILCYDLRLKSWYTYSIANSTSDIKIKNIIPIDSIYGVEGIGIVTTDGVSMIPTTGNKDDYDVCNQTIYIETHELAARIPPQDTIFLCQGEFRFDWIIGGITIYIDGVDYYGRPFSVMKRVSEKTMQYNYIVDMRVDRMVETYRIRIKGSRCGFRLTQMIMKCYVESKKIGLVYGFDSANWHTTHHHGKQLQHHKVDSYNNLVKAIVP